MRPVIPALIAFLLFSPFAAAYDDPLPPIVLPVINGDPVVPAPPPLVPDSTVKLQLAADGSTPQYVVQYDAACYVFLSPGGSVSLTRESGPITIKGKFADGNPTKSTTRKFTKKFVYVFEGIKEGVDELIILPVGAKDETAAKRVTFMVIGQMPIPPPTPPVPPEPKPPVPPVPVPTVAPIAGDGLHVLITYDDAVPLSEDQWAIITGTDARQSLNTKCATPQSYQIWKTSTNVSGAEKKWQDAFARKKDKQPWVIVSNNKNPLGGFEGPLPSNKTEFLALLEKFGGK